MTWHNVGLEDGPEGEWFRGVGMVGHGATGRGRDGARATGARLGPASCALTPDVTLPADIALEGVDRMFYNSPIMAKLLLADPREEPNLMPVRRLQCDDVSS